MTAIVIGKRKNLESNTPAPHNIPFVVLGTAAGIYFGSLVFLRRKALSIALPAAGASPVCALMYFGEYKLMQGSLYRFGASLIFQGLPGIAVAPIDLFVILLL